MKSFCVCLLAVIPVAMLPAQNVIPAVEKPGAFSVPLSAFERVQSGETEYDGPQPFDMLSYRLDLSLAMTTPNLGGKVLMTMRLKEPVDTIVLHALGLSLDTVRVDLVEKNFTLDPAGETFSINLGGTRNAGDTLRIEVAYRRIPEDPRPGSRHGYYFFRDTIGLPSNLGYTFSEPSDARLWLPCYDEPWDKATADLHITVPVGYVPASNGRLVGRTDNGNGTMTWHWREDHQIATYLLCITVSRFTVSSLPYVTSANDTVPLQYYTWPADSAECAMYLQTVHDMMAVFSGLYGAYPFDKYGMTAIIPFGYLGMEHQSITTMNRFVRTWDKVVVHELAHQWWGDLVTCGTWADIWLNESFATYSEALWKEHLGGFSALKSYMKDSLEHFFFASWLGAVYDPVSQGFNLFDDVVYSKGAWILHTLRGVLGDSTFFRALVAYRSRYAGKSAITTELVEVVDSIAGSDMEWFFDQWIFGRGWPVYASEYDWTSDSLRLTIYQIQPFDRPVYRMPIRVRAYHGLTHTDFVVLDSLRTQTFLIPLTNSPDSVVLDPDGWILKQVGSPPLSVDLDERPSSFALHQNFPNPFNPTTTIVFDVPEASAVQVKVFDIVGREVVVIVDGAYPVGRHTVEFDGSSLASGVYILRMSSTQGLQVKKMVLLR